ncbi:hypothetical protein CRG98_032691 [Punica granatum]|uniref:Uncharacterized protein n=1 Tax=Punica granatum TaxID=22663 RepID=A0A2I0ITC8_PUNGR|nr:hypothetical protein CRG98_032691 [Punica granatum]
MVEEAVVALEVVAEEVQLEVVLGAGKVVAMAAATNLILMINTLLPKVETKCTFIPSINLLS